MSEEKTPQLASSEAQPGGQTPPQSSPFTTDASSVSTVYTNFCHVTVTPEELVLDFGLNTQMTPSPTAANKLTHRVVMNFYTAKRLLNALHFSVSRHESAFGTLELDFQKRSQAAKRTSGFGSTGFQQ